MTRVKPASVQQPNHGSESTAKRQPNGQGLDRLEVNIHDAFRRFARQATFLEIVDLVVLRIEQIEDIELEPVAAVEAIAQRRVDNLHAVRANAVVLDQWRWPEIAEFGGAKPADLPHRIGGLGIRHIRYCRTLELASNGRPSSSLKREGEPSARNTLLSIV
jgi:hypothetical protein